MSWHLDAETIESYRGGGLSPAMAASLEAHVVACVECRALVTEQIDTSRAAMNWLAITDRVDEPTRNIAERVLVRLGLSEHLARLIVLTPTFRVAWFGAVATVAALAVVASSDTTLMRGDRGSFAFLVLTPLLPVLGVATAFMPRNDPAYELTASSPISAFELLLVRTAAVLVTSVAVSAVASLALPTHLSSAVAWLLPSLGLTTATLAFARWVPVTVAAGVLSALWLGAAAITARAAAAAQLIADYPPFRPDGQVAFLAIALVASISFVVTRRSYDFRRPA